MFKNILRLFTIIFLVPFILLGCSSGEKYTFNQEAFDALLSSQPINILHIEYVDQKYKNKTEKFFEIIFENNGDKEIKDIVMSFVGWDENNISINLNGGSYLKSHLADAKAEGKYEAGKGYIVQLPIYGDVDIRKFKAIVKSYTTIDGEEWQNPRYRNFVKMYDKKNYSDDMATDIAIEENVDVETLLSENKKENVPLSKEELDIKLGELPVIVESLEYYSSGNRNKKIYPDMLIGVFKNNSDEKIQDLFVNYVAWDENNVPVRIQYRRDDYANYINYAQYENANLNPGERTDENAGIQIEDGLNIKTFKIIVKCYTTEYGKIWVNSYYDDFKEMYAGKNLV